MLYLVPHAIWNALKPRFQTAPLARSVPLHGEHRAVMGLPHHTVDSV